MKKKIIEIKIISRIFIPICPSNPGLVVSNERPSLSQNTKNIM